MTQTQREREILGGFDKKQMWFYLGPVHIAITGQKANSRVRREDIDKRRFREGWEST